jgi:hypothetical protein
MTHTAEPIGRLERVELREAWMGEASHFTPWLANEDNISLLGDAIGLELEVEAQEAGVGPFRADILCKDTATGHYVLVENQIERTDHGHLGQLITYAAGLDAVTVVWIAGRFTDEHRAALDWLNRATNGTFNFFGLEIELWRIGSSPLAPKFNVVCQPNDWRGAVASIAAAAGSTGLTPTQKLHLEFWTQFRKFMEDSKSQIRMNRPSKDHWTNVAVGRSGFTLVVWNGMRDNRSGVQLTILGPLAKSYFQTIHDEHLPAIEAQLGQVEWRLLPHAKESQVGVVRASTPSNPETWPELNLWFKDTIERWVSVFRPIVTTLNAAAVPVDEGGGGDPPVDSG